MSRRLRCDEEGALGIDEACVHVVNEGSKDAKLYIVPWDAYINLCEGDSWGNVSASSDAYLRVSTKFSQHFYYKDDHEWCHSTYNFVEHGVYQWNISNAYTCKWPTVLKEPNSPYIPVAIALSFFALVLFLFHGSKFILRYIKARQETQVQDDLGRLQESESTPQIPVRTTKASTRIHSIDAFRGIALLLMILVNNGGGKYAFLTHSPWNGVTVADLVLPWFAWAMGATIVISLRTQLRISVSRSRILLKCFQRAVILILLGLIVNSQHGNSLATLRFPGVLQLLAISYLLCAALETLFMNAQRTFQIGRFAFLQDITGNWAQWLIILVLMATHVIITFALPVPGCPPGYLGPGGCAGRGKFVNCTAGAAGYIDRLLFGNHSYYKTENVLYGTTLRHDPEGLMNSLSAGFIVYFGVVAGRILTVYYRADSRIFRWLSWSAVLALLGGYLTNFTTNQGMIPFNKNMMTVSFVFITSSSAFCLLTILYFLIDHRHYWSGAPFTYAGMNSITLYMGHYLAKDLFPWEWQITGPPTHAKYLALNLWTTTLWAIIAYVLYKKDIIITV